MATIKEGQKNKKIMQEIKTAKKKKDAEKREKVLGILLKLKEEGKPTEILGWKLGEDDSLIKIPVVIPIKNEPEAVQEIKNETEIVPEITPETTEIIPEVITEVNIQEGKDATGN